MTAASSTIPGTHWVDPLVVEMMVLVTKHYLPYFRLLRVDPAELRGVRAIVWPERGVLAYSRALSTEERYSAVSAAIHRLWEARHRAGLSEYQHFRRFLSAVS